MFSLWPIHRFWYPFYKIELENRTFFYLFEAQRYIEKGPEEINYILPLVSMLTHIRTKGVISIIEEKDEKNLKKDLATLKSKNNVCMIGRRSSLSA